MGIFVGLACSLSGPGFGAAEDPTELLATSFEAGTTGWLPTGAATLTTSASPPPHSGLFAARLTSNAVGLFSTSTQYWLVPTTPGTTLTLSAWLSDNDANTSSVTLRLAFVASDGSAIGLGVRDAPLPGGDSAAFRLVTLSQRAPADAAFARLTVFGTASASVATLGIDDVLLVTDDPPTPTASATATATPTVAPTSTSTAAPTVIGPTSPTIPLATSTAVAAPQVFLTLTNGNFEGGLYCWARVGGTADISAGVIGSGAPSLAAILSSQTDSTKWLEQTIVVAPGWYAASVRLRLQGEASAGWLRIAWYTSIDGSGTQTAVVDSPLLLVTHETREVRLGPVAVPEGVRSARVRIMLRPKGTAAASILVDDVQFATTAAPSAPVAAAVVVPTPAAPRVPRVVASPAPRVQASPPRATTPTDDGAQPAASEVDEPADDALPGQPAAGPASPGSGAARPAASGARAPNRSLLPSAGAAPPTFAPSMLRISELLPDPVQPGNDAEYEWIEIANLGDQPAGLVGLYLADNAGAIELPAVTLRPGGVLVVAGARAQVPEESAFWPVGGISNGLGNGGDRLVLFRADGAMLDALSYGSDATYDRPPLPAPPSGRSLVRNFADDGSLLSVEVAASPSPGVLTGATPPRNPNAAASDAAGVVVRPPGRLDALAWVALGTIAAGAIGAGVVQRYRASANGPGGTR
ncbi:MAG: hypothetical protein DWI59_00965 [Chloroflexi bacterium]|nr:MAG: hypothetical protein DWI59_00965 [Chloroflexota bacterium]